MLKFSKCVGVGLLAAVGTSWAQASLPDMACTGELTTFVGAKGSIQCSGALTLTGGSLSFVDSLDVAADTNLTLVGVTLSAHDISLTAQADITVDALSRLNLTGTPAGQVTLTSRGNTAIEGDISALGGRVALSSTMLSSSRGGTVTGSGRISFGGSAGMSVTSWFDASQIKGIDGPGVVDTGLILLSPAVPEPSGLALMALGLAAIGLTIKRHQR